MNGGKAIDSSIRCNAIQFTLRNKKKYKCVKVERVQHDTTLNNTIEHQTIQYNIEHYNTILNNTIQNTKIKYGVTSYRMIKYDN